MFHLCFQIGHNQFLVGVSRHCFAAGIGTAWPRTIFPAESTQKISEVGAKDDLCNCLLVIMQIVMLPKRALQAQRTNKNLLILGILKTKWLCPNEECKLCSMLQCTLLLTFSEFAFSGLDKCKLALTEDSSPLLQSPLLFVGCKAFGSQVG